MSASSLENPTGFVPVPTPLDEEPPPQEDSVVSIAVIVSSNLFLFIFMI